MKKIEYWHQDSIAGFKITYRDENGVWDGVRWDGQTASFFALGETDEGKAMDTLLREALRLAHLGNRESLVSPGLGQ